MAEDIEQNIKLTGDRDVLAVLQRIGQAGQQAFDRIAQGMEKLIRPAAATEKGLTQIVDASYRMGDGMRTAYEGLKDLNVGLQGFLRLSATATTALFAITKSVSGLADSADETAQGMGITTREFGRLSHALAQNGGDVRTAEQSLFRLSSTLKDAVAGGTRGTQIFDKLRVSFRSASGGARPVTEVLGDIAERFAALPDGAEKTALAIELFGQRSGPRLIPLLNQGRAGIAALGDEAEKLGIVFTKEQAQIGSSFEDAMNRTISAVAGLRNAIGLAFAPVFTEVFDSLTSLLADNREAIQDIAETVAGVLLTAFRTFRDVVVPIMRDVFEAIDFVVQKFNEAFGTNIDTRTTLVIAALGGLVIIFFKAAAAVTALIPGLGTLVSLFTGFPAILGLITGSLKVLVGSITAVTNAVRLLGLVFGGWQVILAAVGIAIGVLLVQYLSSDKFQEHLQAIQEVFQNVWTAIQEIVAGVIQGIQDRWQGFVDWIMELWNGIVEFFKEQWEGIQQLAFDAVDAILQKWEDFKNTIIGYFTQIRDFINEVFNSVSGKAAQLQSGGDSMAGAQARAGGGRVIGPGGPTADRVPIWASNGEFVHRAAAVRKYGLDFMNAINSLRFNPQAFALGGLVGGFNFSPQVSFAEGGLVQQNRNTLNLTIGLETFEGLTADDNTMNKLQRYAVNQQLRRAGRKPKWFK